MQFPQVQSYSSTNTQRTTTLSTLQILTTLNIVMPPIANSNNQSRDEKHTSTAENKAKSHREAIRQPKKECRPRDKHPSNSCGYRKR